MSALGGRLKPFASDGSFQSTADGGRLRRVAVRGVGVTMATDILWALASEDAYQRLVVERKWSPNRYEAWLGACLSQQLLRRRGEKP